MTKVVQTVDNFDNDVIATETVTFVVFGVAYTVDLGPENFERAKEDFGRYTDVADRLGPATVTVAGDNGDDVVLKPRTKAKSKTKLKSATPPGTQSEPPTPAPEPPAQPTLDLGGKVSHLELPPVADGFPPDRAWLRMSKEEQGGPGSKAIRDRGTKYRQDMREWLRYNGYPDLGPRGVVAQEGIDAYWQYVTRARAGRAESA